MAAEAVREVLERLLVALGTPKNGKPRRGALLVALTGPGGTPCTLTVAATGPLGHDLDLDPEALGGAPRGVQELPGAPPDPRPCCGRILAQARLQRSFQICHPPLLPPARGSLWRLLHRTSLVHPEVEFHFCASIDGKVTSRTLRPEPPWAQAGARLRVQSWHFTGPPHSRLRPCPGPPLPLPVPPPLAAAGFGGDLELLPVSALGPPGTPPGTPPGPGAPLGRVQLFDPAGVPVPPPAPPTLGDPSLLGDWGGFGLALAPQNPPAPRDPPAPRGSREEDEEEPVPPDVTFGVRWDPPEGAGDPQSPPEETPRTLLVFLFLRHRDPFGGYDAGLRRLLLAQLEPALRRGRPALARGLRALLHPLLEGLRRQRQAGLCVARAQALAVAALSAVVAASSSSRFRSACLGALQVRDTPALAAAARRRWAEVSRRPGLPRGGSPQKQRRGRREQQEEEEEGPQSSPGQGAFGGPPQ